MAHQTVQFLSPEERTDATNKRVKNKILLSIPENEFWALRPHLELLELDSHQILHEAHDVLHYVYFPNDVDIPVKYGPVKVREANKDLKLRESSAVTHYK